MNHSDNADEPLREELIARVAALDGKQCVIDSNRKTLSATVEALAEVTNVEQGTIASIADQLSVQPRFVNAGNELTEDELRLEKNTRIAKNCAIAVVVLFCFSMAKWLHVNNNIKAVMHEVSSVQSRTADFYLRTGRYPHAFENIGFNDGTPKSASLEKMQMGPAGELLIDTSGLFGSQILLTPVALEDGRSKWQCSTDASWLFKVSSWLCGYQSSLGFRHQ